MSAVSTRKSAEGGETNTATETKFDGLWPVMLARWNMELATLYGKRMQEYLTLPASLIACRSPGDIADAQREFARTMASQYRAAAEKLTLAFADEIGVKSGGQTELLIKAQEEAREIISRAEAQAERMIRDVQPRVAKPEAQDGRHRAA